MISAGITSLPGSAGTLTITHGLTDAFGRAKRPSAVLIICGTATADGFASVTSNRGCVSFGAVGFDEDGTTLAQWCVSSAYYVGGGSQLGAAANTGSVVDLYFGFGTHGLIATATSLDDTQLVLSVSPTISGTKLYWIAVDDLGCVTTLAGGSGFDRSLTLAGEGVGYMVGLAQQPTSSVNGLMSLALAGLHDNTGHEFGGNAEAWAAAQEARWWSGPTSTGQLVEEFENLNPVGGVALLGGWIVEPHPRSPAGLTIEQHSLDLTSTGGIWVATKPSKAQMVPATASAATVDNALRFQGTYAITLGASNLGGAHWANAYGFSVPSLGYDVCMGASQASDGSVLHFRDPSHSWAAGWDHASGGATITRGTLQMPGKLLRTVRTDTGGGSQFNALVIGQLMQGWVPEIVRFG